jgi:antitoxin component of MazEF toxin-antitoxin module
VEAMMIKTLRKQGNSQVLPVDKATMELMGIDLDTPLQVTVAGNAMVVTPAHIGIPAEELDASMTRMRKQYGKVLKNLAK